MIRIPNLCAGMIAVTLVALSFVKPIAAGTCAPVTVKGHAADPAAATTQAQIKLTQEVVRLGGGKVKDSSTDCKPVANGFECKTKAVVCP
jgi:hypothetical protein